MLPVSFEAYATHRPSGENCAFRTVHFACNSGLATRSDQEKYHSSIPFLISAYLASRDQSQAFASKPGPKSAASSSRPEPSAFFREKWKPSCLRFEVNKICLPSGLQIGASSNDGSNVRRVTARRAD